MNTKKWLIDWFKEDTGKPSAEIESSSSINYFSLGYIDSFKFIFLMSDIEEHFGFSFQNDDFTDRRFSSIDGLSAIIDSKESTDI